MSDDTQEKAPKARQIAVPPHIHKAIRLAALREGVGAARLVERELVPGMVEVLRKLGVDAESLI